MIYKRQDLILLKGDLPVEHKQNFVDLSKLKHQPLSRLENVAVVGDIRYDTHEDLVIADLFISGDMTVPDALTNEDVVVYFESQLEEWFSFNSINDIEDVNVIEGDVLDLNPYVLNHILSEVPLNVKKPGEQVYPKGDGWEVLSEKAYETQEKPIDPRLAKLKEFKIEK